MQSTAISTHLSICCCMCGFAVRCDPRDTGALGGKVFRAIERARSICASGLVRRCLPLRPFLSFAIPPTHAHAKRIVAFPPPTQSDVQRSDRAGKGYASSLKRSHPNRFLTGGSGSEKSIVKRSASR